jgi:DNA-binding CsgD family transcriptional regulator
MVLRAMIHLALATLDEPSPPEAGDTAAAPAATLRLWLRDAAGRHGFRGAAYMHLGHEVETSPQRPRRFAAVGGFDAAAYRRHGYFALDPLARRAAKAFLPFLWSIDKIAEEAAAAPFALALRAWGITAGVIAPVQDYARGPAMLNLFRPEREPLVIDPAAIMLDACRLHARLRDQGGPSAPLGEALGAREIEVLRLAALGRTEAETAQELGLSRRGVQFHLARAMAKLDAPNKTAAVARAVRTGLISF